MIANYDCKYKWVNGGSSLLEMIALSSVQPSAQAFIHNASFCSLTPLAMLDTIRFIG